MVEEMEKEKISTFQKSQLILNPAQTND